VIIVSNATPLIALAAAGHLDLLRQLFGRILIPREVYREAVERKPDAPGAAAIGAAPWIEVVNLQDRRALNDLEVKLDPGEAEAIVLAIEQGADLLLIDEPAGRTQATLLGQAITGTLGALLVAKHRGVISAVRPVMDDLDTQAGFRVHPELRERVLRAAGE
jgi:uncharacterized protein